MPSPDTMAAARRDHPSHWDANRTALDVLDSLAVCACGHPRYAHSDAGRCRARRHRCPCRSFQPQHVAATKGAA